MKTRRVVADLFVAAVLIVGFGALAQPSFAQDASTNPRSFPETKVVIGLEGFKPHAKGTLSAENGELIFKKGKKNIEIPAASITDVLTGKDSERAIGGTVGTMTMFAPYGSGRFLSLFRNKVDTLSVEWVDKSGGTHGAVFTMGQGTSWSAKGALLAQGAKTTVPLEKEIEEQTQPKGKKQ
ncbi:MAG TPA: hypothetical protein VEG64_09345 [Candidatus Sulfotelmatobacter sp.]|nr:hypothetical protein [Candidatus Sulfotelmatobacter sp.]